MQVAALSSDFGGRAIGNGHELAQHFTRALRTLAELFVVLVLRLRRRRGQL